ncbi:hypothetical protein HK405_002359, partial [Cladochytrium tenue]
MHTPKAFGFCIFDTAASVLVCLRVLGGEPPEGPASRTPAKGIELFPMNPNGGPPPSADPKPLVVKVDAVARKHVDEHWASIRGTVSGDAITPRVDAARKEVEGILQSMRGSEADSFLDKVVGGGGADGGGPDAPRRRSSRSPAPGTRDREPSPLSILAGFNPNKDLSDDMPVEE